eukprot:4995771-Amphidinium_carterae.5
MANLISASQSTSPAQAMIESQPPEPFTKPSVHNSAQCEKQVTLLPDTQAVEDSLLHIRSRHEILREAEAVILNHIPRAAIQRTNVHVAGSYHPRSTLLSLFTVRGVNVSRATLEEKELLAAIHLLGHTRSVKRAHMPYVSVQLTETPEDEGLPLHCDGANTGKHAPPRSQNTKDEQGQQLKGTLHDINHKRLTFDGRQQHCTTPCKGRRLSVILYTPGRLESVPERVYQQLRSVGFPLPEQPRLTTQWLQPVQRNHMDDVDQNQDSYRVEVVTPLRSNTTTNRTHEVLTVAVVVEHWHTLHRTLKVHEDLQVLAINLKPCIHLFFGNSGKENKRPADGLNRACDLLVREEVMNNAEWKQLLPNLCFAKSCALDQNYGSTCSTSSCHGHVALASFPMKSLKFVASCARTRFESFMKHVLPSSYAHWVQHVSHGHQQHVEESLSVCAPEPIPDAFPTDAVMQPKARTKQQVEPKPRKRRNFTQEEHYDDCGSDTGPIDPISSPPSVDQEAMYLGPLTTFSLTHLCHSWSEQSEQHAQSFMISLAFPRQSITQTSLSRDMQEQACAFTQTAG